MYQSKSQRCTNHGRCILYSMQYGNFRSVADPVHFFRIRIVKILIQIRIQVTQKRPDPTGSGSGSYLDMFMMYSKINNFYDIFLPNLKILWHFKIKDKKLYGQNCILDNFIQRENLNYRGLFVEKGSESGWPKKTGSDRIRIPNTGF